MWTMEKFILSTNTIEDALAEMLILFENGDKDILIKNTGASKTQFNKLFKKMKNYFWCTKYMDGFIVHRLKSRGYNILFPL
jgi:hypothetical protein